MKELYRFPLSHEVVVVVDMQHVRQIPEEFQQRIADIWAKKEPQIRLFESPIVSLVRYSPTHLIGELVDFSAWYACSVDPGLRSSLDIHPLAVTGRTIWREKILVGKRSSTLSAMRGVVECCPSGSVDQSSIMADGIVDLRQAICSELEEEVGISPSFVSSVTAKELYLSADSGVFDVHLDVEVQKEAELSVLKSPKREYDELKWIGRDDVDSVFPRQVWVPLSRHLMKEPFEA